MVTFDIKELGNLKKKKIIYIMNRKSCEVKLSL